MLVVAAFFGGRASMVPQLERGAAIRERLHAENDRIRYAMAIAAARRGMDAERGQPSAHELLEDSENDDEPGGIRWTVTD
jgi:hypothetical protein